ncbi:hypothetical protein ACP275_03G088800 [Erythranthe tilingii]
MSSSSVSILFTIIISVLLFSTRSAASSSSLISDACSTTNRDNFDVKSCVATLESDKKIASAKNFHDLSAAILKAGIVDTTATRAYLIKKAAEKSNQKDVYDQCKLAYDSVIGNIKGALSELDDDPMSSTYDLSLASNDSMQPCLAALRAAGAAADKTVLAGNNDLFIYIYSAIAACDKI